MINKLIGLALVLFAFGCGSSSSAYIPENNWPSKEAAEKLANRPLPQVSAPTKERSPVVEQWALLGELPQSFGYSKPVLIANWEKGVETLITKNADHRLSSAEMCVARQVAAFVAVHNSFPEQPIESFISARCGATTYNPSIMTLSFDSGTEPDVAWGANQAQISKWATEHLASFASANIGIAALNQNGQLRFVMIASKRSVDIQPMTFVQNGSVVIRGVSNVPNTAGVSASITRGEFGFASCERDSRISFPEFAFTCPVESSDSFAYVDFWVGREGRILGNNAARVMVATTTPPQEYVIPAIRRAVALSVTGQETANAEIKGVPIVETSSKRDLYSLEVLRVINHVRAQAGLLPIDLAVEQSKFNSKIAPFMFSQAAREDVNAENETALAVLAGWNVGGFIVNGSFQMKSMGNLDPSALVDAILESASGRELLLAPGVSTLALGTVDSGEGVDVVVSSYELLPEMDFNRRVGEALRDLNRMRAQRNLPAIQESIKLRGIARDTAARIERNEMDLDAAAKKMTEQYMLKYNKGVKYWRFVVNDFDDMNFAKELVETQKGRISILVAPYRPEGYAWGYYAIVIVVEN